LWKARRKRGGKKAKKKKENCGRFAVLTEMNHFPNMPYEKGE